MGHDVIGVVIGASRLACDSTTPVTPPSVKRKMNPSANIIGARNSTDPPHIVAIHEKTLIPVGTAITIDASMK